MMRSFKCDETLQMQQRHKKRVIIVIPWGMCSASFYIIVEICKIAQNAKKKKFDDFKLVLHPLWILRRYSIQNMHDSGAI